MWQANKMNKLCGAACMPFGVWTVVRGGDGMMNQLLHQIHLYEFDDSSVNMMIVKYM